MKRMRNHRIMAMLTALVMFMAFFGAGGHGMELVPADLIRHIEALYSAEGRANSSSVLYENDFETAIGSVSVRGNCELFDYGGRYGSVLHMFNDGSNYQQLRFDLSETLSTGDTGIFSFDLNARQLDSLSFTFRVGNDQAVYSDVVTANYHLLAGALGYYRTNHEGMHPTTNTPVLLKKLQEGQWIHVEIMIELTETGRKLSFFVGSEEEGMVKAGEWTNAYISDISRIFLDVSKDAAIFGGFYIDHLKAVKLGTFDGDLSVEGSEGGTRVVIDMKGYDAYDISALEPSGIVIEDAAGGAVRVSSVDRNAEGNVVLNLAKPLEYDTKYDVKAEGFCDLYGRVFPKKEMISLSEVDDDGNIVLRVKDISFVTWDGQMLPAQAQLPPEIREIRLQMNTAAGAWKNGVVLNGVTTDCDFCPEEKILSVKWDGVLKGGTDYTVSVTDSLQSMQGIAIKPYSFSFSTTAGSFLVAAPEWVTSEGKLVSADGIKAGNVLKLTVRAVNTLDQTRTAYLTYAAMKGPLSQVDFQQLTTTGGKIEEAELEYVVTGTENSLSGWVFDGMENLVPLTAAAQLLKRETETGIISLEGEAEPAQEVMVQFYAPGKTAADLTKADWADDTKILLYQGLETADTNGVWHTAFDLPLDTSGAYGLYVTGQTPRIYVYRNPQENAEALLWLNSLTAVPTQEEFDLYRPKLGFYSDLYDGEDEQVLDLCFKAKTEGLFENCSGQKAMEVFQRIAAIAALNRSKVLNIFDQQKSLNMAAGSLGSFLNQTFVTEALERDATLRLSGRNLASVKEFDRELETAFALAAVRYPDGYGNIQKVLNKLAADLGIPGDCITDKACRSVSGGNYRNVDALIHALKQLNPTNSNNSGSGGGGGLGGRGSYGGATASLTDAKLSNELVRPEEPRPYSARFRDLDTVPWAQEVIEQLAERGVIQGKADGIFAPDDWVTREEFAKMMVLALDLQDDASPAVFQDVHTDDWFAPYVYKAAKAGIVKGKTEQLFGAGEFITRQDMAVMIERGAFAAGAETDMEQQDLFEDDARITDYAKESIYALKNRGILLGQGNGFFEPQGCATRAEAAKLVYSIISGGK